MCRLGLLDNPVACIHCHSLSYQGGYYPVLYTVWVITGQLAVIQFTFSFVHLIHSLFDVVYIRHILTDMKRLLITFDDETADLLEGFPNMSEKVREATKLYIGHILPDTAEGLRMSYKVVIKLLQDIDSKLDYMDRKLE